MEEGVNLFHPYLRVYLFGAGIIEFPDGTRCRAADWSVRSQSLTLFLLLLCHPERRVSRDALVGAIWPGQSYRAMGSSLNVAKSLLATALEAACGSPLIPRASGEPPGYRLCEQTLLWTDIDACQESIRLALNTKRVEEALSLWESAYTLMRRGSFLADYADAYWTQADWVQVRAKRSPGSAPSAPCASLIFRWRVGISTGRWRSLSPQAKLIRRMKIWRLT